jgi:hypothetical protein
MNKKIALDALQVTTGTLFAGYLAYSDLAWAAAIVGWISGGLAIFLLHSWTSPDPVTVQDP